MKNYLPKQLEFSSNWFHKFQVNIYRPYLSISRRETNNKEYNKKQTGKSKTRKQNSKQTSSKILNSC